MVMALSAIEPLYLIMSHDCHVYVIGYNYLHAIRESASKLDIAVTDVSSGQ